MNYNLYNMQANIKNGQKVNKVMILQKKNNICTQILNILWDEGYILGYKTSKTDKKKLEIFLKYKYSEPCIKQLIPISKSSNRVYMSLLELNKITTIRGLVIVSTDKGLMTLKNCIKFNKGGELLLICL
nr:ribosomal protein S8 [Rhizosolenia setigera]